MPRVEDLRRVRPPIRNQPPRTLLADRVAHAAACQVRTDGIPAKVHRADVTEHLYMELFSRWR